MPSRATLLLQDLSEGILGLIYPSLCVGCEGPLVKPEQTKVTVETSWPNSPVPVYNRFTRWLCPECESLLEPVCPPFCSLCGNAFFGRSTVAFRCANCSHRRLWFDFARGAFRGEGLTRELIHRFKYENHLELRGLLGTMLGETLGNDPRLAAAENERWPLVPVPLHSRRFRERGYNQAWELCLTLRRRFPGLPLAPILRRTRYTTMQASLHREDRLNNLQGAFALSRLPWNRHRVSGRTVLLVDDVLTTGATLSECARILIEEGRAARVIASTLARG